MPKRRPYPSDVSDEEWAFVAPYLALLDPDAAQRRHDLRDVFDALRWAVRSGAPRGFVLLPRRWVVERSLAWVSRFRRMARDHERLSEAVAGLHLVAFVCVLLPRIAPLIHLRP